MKKLFIKNLVVLFFLAAFAGFTNAQQISIANENACLNDTSLVSVNYSNINSLAALTLVISYDTAVLSYAGFTNTSVLTPGVMFGVPTSGPNAWKVVVSWVDNTLAGVNLVSGKLCDLKFKYKGGSSNLTILPSSELVNPSLNPINASYTNGSINPTILSHPVSVQICEDVATSFSVTAASGSTFQWQVQNGVQWDNILDNATYSGANTNTLQLLKAGYSLNNNVYRCVVTKTCTQVSNSATLTVFQKPVIVINNDTTICAGNSLLINGAGTTGSGLLQYSWNQGLGSGVGFNVTPSVSTNYLLTVTDTHNCFSVDSVIVTVLPLPVVAGAISGSASVCQGQNAVNYSVPVITNAASYIWTLPTGATGSSTSNTITVDYSTTAVSGNITVKGNNTCGIGSVSTYAITVNPLPLAAGNITGSATVCQGENAVIYSVPVITNATSYIWTLPTGASGSSTSNTITVNYSTSAISGNITVKGSNSCGEGVLSTFAINVIPLVGAAGSISGSASVCQGQNTVVYNVPAISNATSYIWTLPTGASGSSTSNTITVNYSASAASGNITVKGNNSCGDGLSSTLAITANPLPVAAGIISGLTTVCQGQNAVTYSVPVINNATSYIWTLPTGASGSSTSNTITVNYSASAVSGNITVKGTNSCGDGATSNLAVIVTPLVGAAGTISGSSTVCQGQASVTYSVPVIINATSYIWTLPTGASGSSTSNTITVNFAVSAISGNVTVMGNNSCGDGLPSNLAVTVNPIVGAAGIISGLTTVCQGQNAVTYSVPTISNASSYIWTLPTGASGSSTSNTITVNYSTSAVSGNITVKGNNSCGDGSVSSLAITVNPLPVAAGVISGLTSVCQGQNSVTYSVPTITNATTYIWTLPTGASGSSTSNTITVNYSTSAISGNITVKGSNSCGDGAISNLAVTVTPLVGAAGTISGLTTVCQGQASVTYSVPAISNATSYIWTLPTGGSGSSTSNTITVNYSTSAVSGNISVKGNNSCGDGSVSTLAITVNPLPVAAGVISGLTTVCQGQSSVTYSVPTILNATSYIWTLPTGASGSSTSNTITVNYSTSAISGNISVKGSNTCGNGIVSNLAVTVNPLPAAAGTISGFTAICQGQNSVTYSVPTISNATSYIWTLPTGASGSSTTNTITVNYSASAISGNITVKGNNACGDGLSSTLAITVSALVGSAGTITGTTTVCQGQSPVTYSVPTISNATSYIWTLPTGASGSSTTNTITVSYSTTAISGNITVKGSNSCGNGSSSTITITVNPLPVAAGTISGTTTICQGQNSVTYSVPAISNATSYIWTLPTGASGSSTTNTITVNYSTSAVSGNISVKGNNACGDGIASSLAITVNPLVGAAGTISGLTSVCQGQNAVTYSLPTISNATSYIWTLPTGASGSSTTNTITVNYSATASSGNITVKGSNSCGDGSISTLAITVNPLPSAAGAITSVNNDSVSINENNAVYTVPSITNATTYIWAYSGTGANFVGGYTTTVNNVTVNFSATATSGNLTVKGHNACGDGVISANYPIYVSPIGINEIYNSLICKVYPNPTKGNICIEIEALGEKSEISLYDLQGKLMYSETINNYNKKQIKEINLSTYTKGIYFVKIKNNKFVNTEKIILQ